MATRGCRCSTASSSFCIQNSCCGFFSIYYWQLPVRGSSHGTHVRRGSHPFLIWKERKTLLLLGMVGAIVAELSGTSQTLAFVIFGIGALMRFRTVLDNPKLTVKAITVVVIG